MVWEWRVTLCEVYPFESGSYAYTCEDFVIIQASSAPNLAFSPQKIYPLYCGKGMTKYNVFSKSCTWWTCPREPADPGENWQQEKLLGLEFSSKGWGTRSGQSSDDCDPSLPATLSASHVVRMKGRCVKVCFHHSPRQPCDFETLQSRSTGGAEHFPAVQEGKLWWPGKYGRLTE